MTTMQAAVPARPARAWRRRTMLAGPLTLLCWTGAVPAEAQQSPWTVTELRALAESDHTTVADVNGAGISVGSSGPVPVVWDAAGTPTALPLPPGYSSGEATALNEVGHVVGTVSSVTLPTQGVIWRDGTATLLGESVHPFDVTNFDGVVGEHQDETGFHAFVMLPGGSPVDLADGDGSETSRAEAVNDWGMAGGLVFGLGGFPSVAAGWYRGQAFPVVRGAPLGAGTVDVNNAGVFLVNIQRANGPVAGLVGPSGELVLLNDAAAVDMAVDLNEQSVAVGFRSFGPITSREGVFYAYGGALPLRTLVPASDVSRWNLQFPVALNDDLWVVGNTFDPFHDSWLLRPP